MNTKKNIAHSKALEAEALEKCNSEPIEWIGQIQEKGFLLAFETDKLIVSHASANISQFLKTDIEEILGASIRDILKENQVHQILNIAARSSSKRYREHVGVFHLVKNTYSVSLYRERNLAITEFVEIDQDEDYLTINSNLKFALANLQGLESEKQILQTTTKILQNLTGFNRVMAYKFLPDNSGEVVAESLSAGTNSFLGLRFPAFDIPPRAREMFLKNPLRVIYNTSGGVVDILSNNIENEIINLSLSLLRTSAPVHLQYLRNMGVSMSMTLPIVIDGKLWGLLAHHHNDTALRLTQSKTHSAELIGQTTGMILENVMERKVDSVINSLLEKSSELVSTDNSKIGLNKFWNAQAENIAKIIPCDGVAYVTNGEVLRYKNCPELNTINQIANRDISEREGVLHTNNLSAFVENGQNESRGFLLIPLVSGDKEILLFFFRNAASKNVSWAGSPEKELVFEKEGVRLHPRSSFIEYQKEHHEVSDDWDSTDLKIANKLREVLNRHLISNRYLTSKEDREKQILTESKRLKFLVKELSHRIKNILGLVSSISKQTVESETSIENYVKALEQRIAALAEANSMLTERNFSSIPLKELLKQQLRPFKGVEKKVSIEGEDLWLPSNISSLFVLVFHELITNSNKYGSMSEENGKTLIKWFKKEDDLIILWQEQCSKTLKKPEKLGFGMKVIENAISFELGGNANINFKSTGLEVQYRFPYESIITNDSEEFVALQIEKRLQHSQPEQKNVLVLEDDFINANQLKETLERLSPVKAHIFSNQAAGLKALNSLSFKMALLDVNLKTESSATVAQACINKGIALFYVTGYGKDFLENPSFPKAPVFSKPISDKTLSTLLEETFKN